MNHDHSPDGLPSSIADWFVHILEFEIARYALVAGGVFLVVNLLLRRALAERKIRASAPDGGQIPREIVVSLRTCAVFALTGLVSVYGIEAGLLRGYDDPAALGWPWFVASVIVLIVLHDAWFYWTHRLMHDPRLFRRLHRQHHKSHNPSPFTAYSFDASEAAIHGVFVPLALVFIPVSQLAIFLFLGYMIIRNVIGHSGYELFPARRDGRPVFDWMTTVTHHDLHHAQAGWNYGLYFTWWDRLMGTEHPLYHEKFAAAVRKPLEGSAVAALGRPAKGAAVTIAAAALVAAAVSAHPQAAAANAATVAAPSIHVRHETDEKIRATRADDRRRWRDRDHPCTDRRRPA